MFACSVHPSGWSRCCTTPELNCNSVGGRGSPFFCLASGPARIKAHYHGLFPKFKGSLRRFKGFTDLHVCSIPNKCANELSEQVEWNVEQESFSPRTQKEEERGGFSNRFLLMEDSSSSSSSLLRLFYKPVQACHHNLSAVMFINFCQHSACGNRKFPLLTQRQTGRRVEGGKCREDPGENSGRRLDRTLDHFDGFCWCSGFSFVHVP